MKKAQGTLLVVDDNKSILSAVKMLLQTKFEEIITLSNPNGIRHTLQEKAVDVILLDMNFKAGMNTGNEGLFWLSEIKKWSAHTRVVLFTAYADIELAVRGMKEGATDFIVKPWNNEKLIETLTLAYDKGEKQNKRNASSNKEENKSSLFWGSSRGMAHIRTLLDKVADTDANILITGENGTGKEVIAKEIHRLSRRHNHTMITVDMGAITETLFESELFGHTKGSFTDAYADREGKFQAANNSTLFLDEIGNLPHHLQAKLLTALQQRRIVRVGSNEPIDINIRLVCATNRNLEEMVQQEIFREDLLYRINTIHIHIPPLRERKEDIIPLAEMFVKKMSATYNKKELTLSTEAQKKLKEHCWHGNIRELEHVIEKAVIISDGELLLPEHFIFATSRKEELKVEKLTTLEEMECKMIRQTMLKHEGNLSLVATTLGISRQTLYNKIKRYEL